jgi:hypothetical protein
MNHVVVGHGRDNDELGPVYSIAERKYGNRLACDACTKGHKPCARLVRHGSEVKLCLYPSTALWTGCDKWEEKAFWC